MSIQADDPAIVAFYNRLVSRKVRDFERGNRRVECGFRRLVRIMEDLQPARVLEVGCGIGAVSFRLASRFPACVFVAVDPSDQSIQIAHQRFNRPNLTYHAGYLDDIRQGDFDLIFLMDVLEHIPADIRSGFFTALEQRLSKRGRLFFTCPTPQHQSWLRQHAPSELQPVDHDIDLAVVQQCETRTGRILTFWQRQSIWKQYDYVHMIFSPDISMSEMPPAPPEPRGLRSLPRRILRKLQRIAHSDPPDICSAEHTGRSGV